MAGMTEARLRKIIKEELRSRSLREGSYFNRDSEEDGDDPRWGREDEVTRFIEYMRRVEDKISAEIFDLVTALENMGEDSGPLQDKMDELRGEFEGYYRVLSGATGD